MRSTGPRAIGSSPSRRRRTSWREVHCTRIRPAFDPRMKLGRRAGVDSAAPALNACAFSRGRGSAAAALGRASFVWRRSQCHHNREVVRYRARGTGRRQSSAAGKEGVRRGVAGGARPVKSSPFRGASAHGNLLPTILMMRRVGDDVTVRPPALPAPKERPRRSQPRGAAVHFVMRDGAVRRPYLQRTAACVRGGWQGSQGRRDVTLP
jgi:hypothetical protein